MRVSTEVQRQVLEMGVVAEMEADRLGKRVGAVNSSSVGQRCYKCLSVTGERRRTENNGISSFNIQVIQLSAHPILDAR